MKVQYALEQPQNVRFCDDLYAFEFVPHSLFVANIPPELTSEIALRACFNDFGHCVQTSLRKKEGDASYALVSMASKQSVDNLVKAGHAQLFIEKSGKYITVNRLDMHMALASTGGFHKLWKEALQKAERFVYPKPRPTSSRWRAAFEKVRQSNRELGRNKSFAAVAMGLAATYEARSLARDSIFRPTAQKNVADQSVTPAEDVHDLLDNERGGEPEANITKVLKSMHDQLEESLQRQLSEHEQRVREMLSQIGKDSVS